MEKSAILDSLAEMSEEEILSAEVTEAAPKAKRARKVKMNEDGTPVVKEPKAPREAGVPRVLKEPNEKVAALAEKLQAVLNPDPTAKIQHRIKTTNMYVGLFRENKMMYLSPALKADQISIISKDVGDKFLFELLETELEVGGKKTPIFKGTTEQILALAPRLVEPSPYVAPAEEDAA